MKLLAVLGVYFLVAVGLVALIVRPEPDSTRIVRVEAVPDKRVPVLQEKIQSLEAELNTLKNRPPGMSGPDVRALFDQLAGAPLTDCEADPNNRLCSDQSTSTPTTVRPPPPSTTTTEAPRRDPERQRGER